MMEATGLEDKNDAIQVLDGSIGRNSVGAEHGRQCRCGAGSHGEGNGSMNVLNAIFYCAAATSIIAIPFLVVNWVRYMMARRRTLDGIARPPATFPIKSVSFFVVPILVGGAVVDYMTSFVRREALEFLQNLPGQYAVRVNQQHIADAEKVISTLEGIAPYSAHHSHPAKRIRIEIYAGQRDLTLELGRDSAYPQEYWVFCPKYGVTSNNEIGRITTPIFDKY